MGAFLTAANPTLLHLGFPQVKSSADAVGDGLVHRISVVCNSDNGSDLHHEGIACQRSEPKVSTRGFLSCPHLPFLSTNRPSFPLLRFDRCLPKIPEFEAERLKWEGNEYSMLSADFHQQLSEGIAFLGRGTDGARYW